MTSYPFLKMAAATAKYYFRFRICWCHCPQKVIVYQQTKFRRYISIGGWDITTFGFEIQTSAILEFYFRFDLDQFAVICMLFCIRLSNFVQIGAPTAEIWRHSHRWADSTLKLHGGWHPRRNHVCRVSNWNLHGLQFYRGSNFRFLYWF